MRKTAKLGLLLAVVIALAYAACNSPPGTKDPGEEPKGAVDGPRGDGPPTHGDRADGERRGPPPGGDRMGPPPGGGKGPGMRPMGPPPGSIEACEGKAKGDDCVVKLDEKELAGTCGIGNHPRKEGEEAEEAEGKLACMPGEPKQPEGE